MDGLKPSDIQKSLQYNENFDQILQSGQGAGKSGSFFFFSHDKKFIIKTMRGNEKTVLSNMLVSLIQHFESTNNKSLLGRIYGMFTIKTSVFHPVDIIIMQNTINMMDFENPKMVFDLKGS